MVRHVRQRVEHSIAGGFVVAMLLCATVAIVPTRVDAAVTSVGPVRALRAMPPSGTSVTLVWLPPLQIGATITNYRVEKQADGGTWDVVTNTVPTGVGRAAVTYTVSGLTKGVRYRFRVRALAGSTEGLPVVLGIAHIAAGWNSSCVVQSDSTAWCIGQNEFGQLGNGSKSPSSSPVQVQGLTGVVQVTVGMSHACALVYATPTSTAGSVKCWGENSSGQLGNASTTESSVPVNAGTRVDFVSVAAGGQHTCALTTTNDVYCWGDGSFGQLGRGTTTSSSIPVKASTVSGAVAIGVGTSFTCAIVNSLSVTGGLKCWGDNDDGQISTTTSSSTILSATTVSGVSNAVAVVGGMLHMCVLTTSGEVRCFGSDESGQKGKENFQGAVAVAAGVNHTCALAETGTRWCWGDLPGAGSSTATPVGDPGSVSQLAEGSSYGCVVSPAGGTTCSGVLPLEPLNVSELTSAQIIPSTTPGSVRSLVVTRTTSSNVSIEWGQPSDSGGLTILDYVIEYSSDGGTSYFTVPDAVSSQTSATITGLRRNTSYRIRVSAVNARGQGESQTVDARTMRTVGRTVVPGPVQGLTATASLSSVTLTWSSPAFDGGSDVTDYRIEYSANGTSWSTIDDGVGTNTTATVTGMPGGVSLRYRVSAVNVIGAGVATTWGASWVASGGFHSCVRTTDSRVQCWGDNEWGQLGTGSTDLTSSSPLQISTVTNAVVVTLGNAFSCIGTATRRVNCWGQNNLGQVGDGSTTTRRSPVLISGVTLPVVSTRLADSDVISSGMNHTCAVISTGQLKCWGDDSSGQVTGRSPTTDDRFVASPFTAVDVNGSPLTSVSGVAAGASHTCAVFDANRVWCWGDNSLGQTDVPQGLANVVSIVAGGDRTCVLRDDGAVKCWGETLASATDLEAIDDAVQVTVSLDVVCVLSSNGVVRCFGSDDSGQLGRSLVLPTSTSVGAGSSHVCAIGDDGLVRCWGDNSSDQLGNNTVGVAQPVTVTGITPRVATVAAAPSAPGVPSLVATRSSQVDISWTAPFNGGSTLTDYVIEVRRQDSDTAPWTTINDGTSVVATATLVLQQGIDFLVRISARNSIGLSSPSPSLTVRAYGVPQSPTSLRVDGVGDGRITYIWDVPTNDGGSAVTRYEVELSTGEKCSTTATSCMVTGLVNGVTYEATVYAWNAAGRSVGVSISAVPVTTPGPVRNFESVDGDGAVTLRWQTPANDGGATISAYQLSRDGGDWYTVYPDSTGSQHSLSLSQLVNGMSYLFKVRAVNDAGTGTDSSSLSVVPMTFDEAPVLETPVVGDARATLSWSPGRWGGGTFLRYEVVDARGTILCTTTVAVCTISGLTNGTPTALDVRTVTSAGTSAVSTVVVTSLASTDNPVDPPPTPTPPGEPTNVSAMSADRRILLQWSPPTAIGTSEILGYEYSIDGGTEWLFAGGASTRSITITALTNGFVYDVRVRARNAGGAGTLSGELAVVPSAPPDSPTAVSATPGDEYVVVTWTPGFDGGSAVTRYEYSTTSGASWIEIALADIATDGDRRSASIRNVVNGVSYSFRIRAVNKEGGGTASSDVSVTPVGRPGAPSVSVTPEQSSVVLTWGTVADDGGSPIVDFRVEYATWNESGQFEWAVANSAVSARTLTIGSLTRDSRYVFRVRARNAVGVGSWSTSESVAPLALSTEPTQFTAVSMARQLSVSWSEPTDSGGLQVLGYEYQLCNAVNSGCSDWSRATSPALIGDLGVGITYTVHVRAVTRLGGGEPAVFIAKTLSLPQSPSDVQVNLDADALTMSVSWSASLVDAGEAPIRTYQVTARNQTTSQFDATCVAEADIRGGELPTSCVLDGVTLGSTYMVEVVANNGVGDSAPVTRSVVVQRVPDPPSSLVVLPGDASVRLSWAVPLSNGGSPVLRYEYSQDDGASWVSAGTSLAVTLAGLENGTTYSFRVRSITIVGASAASDAVTGRPMPPTPVVGTVNVYGPPVVGQSVTCVPSSVSASNVYSYAWRRGTAVISGAVSASYNVKRADIGFALKCSVTATNMSGRAVGTSGGTSAVVNSGLVALRAPSLSPGRGVGVGTVLTCAPGTWTGTPTRFVYRFRRNSTVTLNQGPSPTYRVRLGDKSAVISCEVLAINSVAKRGGVALAPGVRIP